MIPSRHISRHQMIPIVSRWRRSGSRTGEQSSERWSAPSSSSSRHSRADRHQRRQHRHQSHCRSTARRARRPRTAPPRIKTSNRLIKVCTTAVRIVHWFMITLVHVNSQACRAYEIIHLYPYLYPQMPSLAYALNIRKVQMVSTTIR